MTITVDEIAEGAAFDVVEAVRAIARHLTLREADRPTLAKDSNLRKGMGDDLEELVGARLAELLRCAGLDSAEKVRQMPDAALLRVDGIGAKTVERIRIRLDECDACTTAARERQLGFEQLDAFATGVDTT